MQKVTEYFGERYDTTDPGKVLRVIRDFMLLFDKAIFEIKVQSMMYTVLSCSSHNTVGQGHAGEERIVPHAHGADCCNSSSTGS